MKTIYLLLNKDNVVQGWADSRGMEQEVEVEVHESHPLFYSLPRLFIYKDGQVLLSQDIILQNAKDKKDAELNKACQDSILAGFSHTIEGVEYWFSYDKEAQQNFTDAQTVLSDGLMTEIAWTVKKDEEYTRITISKAVMDELKIVILLHKTNNISRYRDELMPLVESATSIEEVEKITWENYKQETSSLSGEKESSPIQSDSLTEENLVM